MLLESFLENSAERFPEKCAAVAGNRRITYAALERDANRLAHGLLKDAGVERGDRVVIFLDNGIEAALAIFATLKAGAVFIVMNATSKAPNIRYVVDNARAALLVTDVRKLSLLKESLEDARSLKSIIVIDADGSEAAVGAGARVPRLSLSSLLDAHSIR